MKHYLKTWTQFFEPVKAGIKTFEVRRCDRPFKVGDVLVLQEFIPSRKTSIIETAGGYTGEQVERVITYITDYEQKPGFVLLGYAPNPANDARLLLLKVLEEFRNSVGVSLPRFPERRKLFSSIEKFLGL